MKELNIVEFFDNYSSYLESTKIIHSKEDLEIAITSSTKPNSLFSLVSFLPKLNSLRIGIFELAFIEEYYSLGVVYRTFIEHAVKAQYIWMRMISEESDSIGNDYLGTEGDLEKIQFMSSIIKQTKIQGSEPKIDIFSFIREMKLLSSNGTSKKNIERESSSFKMFKMVD